MGKGLKTEQNELARDNLFYFDSRTCFTLLVHGLVGVWSTRICFVEIIRRHRRIIQMAINPLIHSQNVNE